MSWSPPRQSVVIGDGAEGTRENKELWALLETENRHNRTEVYDSYMNFIFFITGTSAGCLQIVSSYQGMQKEGTESIFFYQLFKNIVIICSTVSILCGLHSSILFALVSVYSKKALGSAVDPLGKRSFSLVFNSIYMTKLSNFRLGKFDRFQSTSLKLRMRAFR